MRHGSIALAGLLLAALAAPAHAASHASCSAAARAAGNTIAATSAGSYVWHNRAGTYSGCTKTGKVHRLGKLCCENVHVALAGRYLAYSYTGTGIGDESSKLGLIDLANGKNLRIKHLLPDSEGADDEIDTNGFVSQFGVTSRGVLVWIQSTGGETNLRAGDGSPRTERIIATSPSGKFKLASNGKSVSYRAGGKSQRSALRSP